MSIIGEIEALVSLIPKLEKAVSDAKALESSPQGAALIADIEAIIAEAKTLAPVATNTPPPVQPAA